MNWEVKQVLNKKPGYYRCFNEPDFPHPHAAPAFHCCMCGHHIARRKLHGVLKDGVPALKKHRHQKVCPYPHRKHQDSERVICMKCVDFSDLYEYITLCGTRAAAAAFLLLDAN